MPATLATMVERGGEPLGAEYLGDGRTAFRVWAPKVDSLELILSAPKERRIALLRDTQGYWQSVVDDVHPGARYQFRLAAGPQRPDPASRFQPDGVHQASEVIDRDFDWTDDTWRGLTLDQYILYELHIGTFTREGTFDAAISRLDVLVELGVTAIEIMPVAQFSGSRNWGYDGVYPFAVQNTYGGPAGLKRLVDAAHARGLAVVLDVVYNHLGPEGNYLNEFGPYVTDRYHTPWGSALNFDGPESDHVRRYFIDNALEWVTDYHVDALRLDAIHAIVDESARPFLLELAQAVRTRGAELGRHVYTIAESNRNDPKHCLPIQRGGYGLDAQWNDDFEHALRVAVTGSAERYYCDFVGLDKVAKAYREGFVLDGGYSEFRHSRHGAPSHSIAAEQLVVFLQNHDQVGNRPAGERLGTIVDFETQKLAAATLLLSPYVPLLFMGEEYGETAPFYYFVNHGDQQLSEAVRRGRRAEFSEFEWPDEWPDPCRVATFNHSRLNFSLRHQGQHAALWSFYQELIRLRKSVPALARLAKDQMEVSLLGDEQVIFVRRWERDSHAVTLLNFSESLVEVSITLPSGRWEKSLDSADPHWQGPGSALPPSIKGSGEVTLHLARRSAALWLVT